MNRELVLQVEQQLEYHFKNPKILQESMRHSSHVDDRLESNERMEFLGDSVLGFIICKTLFNRFPQYLEGDLTKIKSLIVSRKTCSKIAGDLGLPDFVRVGKGTEQSRAMNGSIAAGTLEAVIAAIFLDGGIQAAEEFILRIFAPLIDQADADHHHENYKSILQQHCQRHFCITPTYELLDEKGPDHNKCFEIGVLIKKDRFQSAWGITKKEAEQKAAFNALQQLGLLGSSADADDPSGLEDD